MAVVETCAKFGWTYEEYMSQPAWFLDLCREFMLISEKHAKAMQKKAQGK